MKKIFLPLMLMILLLTGCGSEKPSNTAKRIIIGIDDEFAPMTFRDAQGNIVGFDVDLAKEVARRMGVEFEFRPINWNNKKIEITSGSVDIIWSGCDIMNDYREYMIFSKPYMDNRQILLVKKDTNRSIRSEGDLAGKVVGTQAGSNSEDYVNENKQLKNSFAGFNVYRNVREGFTALEDGQIDALIIDEIAGRYEMSKESGKFSAVEVTIGPVTEFGIGFRKDETKLRNEVQNAFDSMIKDGTARRISEQWFQADLIKSRI